MSIKLLHLKVQVISYWFRIMIPLLYKYFFCGIRVELHDLEFELLG